jgi:signal transduction histidine kinase
MTSDSAAETPAAVEPGDEAAAHAEGAGGATPVAPLEAGGEAAAVGGKIPAPKARRRRGPTIRLKLTLWYGGLFFLAGVLLIAINYFMVRDSLAVAPGKARAVVAERYDLPPEALETGRFPSQPGAMPRIVEINGVSVARLLDEAQRELKEEALRQLWTRSLLALAIMAVITFGFAWLLAGRMLRPLHAITSTARRLSESTLHERIALKGPRDELKELADTFDGMLGRLDTAFTAQKDFVANASHELRTPLTIIRTEIDVALSDPKLSRKELREMGTAVTEAVDRSENLIDGLLVLAGANTSPNLSALDLAEIAQNEVNLASGEADALGLRLELDLQAAPVRGERSLLERMVGNLVQNAIRHNLPDGWFAVKTSVAGTRALLEVANSGPVVPPNDVARLFDRFFRPDKSRSRKTGGFGLGLSIVQSVATAHGGTVDLVAPKEGGLRVTVSLPARPPASRGSGS